MGKSMWAIIAAGQLAATVAAAAVQTREIEYQAQDTPMKGFFAWDDATKGKRPGVLVVHEWWGHNEHARTQARRLAEAGYVAFALDMFGKGKVTEHPKEAEGFMRDAISNASAMQARFEAAMGELQRHDRVDREKVAAIGYCFGGAVVLGQVRAGADLDAAGTFHAPLAPNGPPAAKGKVKARLLVQTGGNDPMIPPEQVEALKKEMKEAGAKLDVIVYPKARHSFTNPEADKRGMEALRYDADADKRSFAALVKLLKDVFKG